MSKNRKIIKKTLDLLMNRENFKTVENLNSYLFVIYDSCMDSDNRNKLKSEPLLNKLE